MAQTANNDANYKQGELIAYPVKANTRIFKGALCCVDATGYTVEGGDTVGHIFIGNADEEVDNTGGTNGAKVVRIRKRGTFQKQMAGAAITALGQTAMIVDGDTVALAATTTNDIACGKICEIVDASTVRVRIDNQVN